MTMISDTTSKALNRLVGRWTTEATHPAVPGVIVHGSAAIEWLEGGRFLIQRTRNDHPDFPDAIAIIGATDADRTEALQASERAQPTMHYFDSRGVFRVYEVAIDGATWKLWRNAEGFSQRFTGAFADEHKIIAGLWQMCQDGTTWQDDLRITYRRST
jgi:hypothetical protein